MYYFFNQITIELGIQFDVSLLDQTNQINFSSIYIYSCQLIYIDTSKYICKNNILYIF